MSRKAATCRQRAARTRAILRAYAQGERQESIAARLGCSLATVSKTLGRMGARRPKADLVAELVKRTRARARDLEYRSLQSERMRAHWNDPEARARRLILGEDPRGREDYLLLAGEMGAAYAREAMGLPPRGRRTAQGVAG